MRIRRCLLSLVAVVALTVPIAGYVFSTAFYIYNSGPRINAYSWIRSGEYPTGPTWVQVRFPAYGIGSCPKGFAYAGNWCADNAHSEGFGIWHSEAEVAGPYYPYGCWYAETQQYIEGIIQRNSGIQQCYGEPPPACDPALDGTYQPGACVSPILIDTSANADYKLDPQVRVSFDLDVDGSQEQAGWTKRNSTVAFLAFDDNGNGVIDDGREVFGDHTRKGSSNGFAALAKVAKAGNASVLDASNPLFARLLLWRDANQDGYSQTEELTPASDELEAIGLGYYLNSAEPDHAGNTLLLGGWARKVGGEQIKIYDAYLRVQQ